MEIGRKIFFDVVTGETIYDTGERTGSVVALSAGEWVERIEALKSRTSESFGVVELDYGELSQDFTECNGYRVNPDSGALEFSYPDPADPAAPPVYQRPLSKQLQDVRAELDQVKADGADNTLMLLDMFEMINPPS